MAITQIARDLTHSPNIVHVKASNTLAQVVATDYVSGQADNISALNNGTWDWVAGDIIAMQASDGNEWLQFSGSDFNTFVAMPVGGGLSSVLLDGRIFVGNAANVATGVAVTGDIGITNAGVVSITAGSIVNADVNASAAIAFSKLAALPSAQVLVGSAGNVATAVAVTGDVAISNAGVTSIAAGAIVNADVNAAAAIDFSKLAALPSGEILVGSAGTVPTAVALSGDATLVASGALTLGTVVNASKAATYAPEAVIAGMPVLHVFNMVAGATATRTITTSQKITVVDAWVVLKGLGTAADTIQVKNAAAAAITNAMDINVADTSVVRAGTIDDATRVVNAGANLECTITDGGGADVPACDVYVLCYVTP